MGLAKIEAVPHSLPVHTLFLVVKAFCVVIMKRWNGSNVLFELSLGDASYCTPEQYKDCAEPALCKSFSLHAHAFACTKIRMIFPVDASFNVKPALKGVPRDRHMFHLEED